MFKKDNKMTTVSAKHFYSINSVTLITAFNDEEVIRAKLADSGAKDVSITISTNEDGFQVEINRTMPADVPGALKSFVGEWNQIRQTETWTGSAEQGYQCQLAIEIEDVPVTITGTMNMTSQGLLTTNHVQIDISCGIPLLGGQVEKFVAASVEKSVAQEFAFLKEHLG